MQNLIVPGLVLFAVCADGFSQETILSVPRVTSGSGVANAERSCGPCEEFMNRLKAAIAGGDMVAIQALYQTNGATVEQLRNELSRWAPMFEEDVKSRLTVQTQGTIFRDFSLSNPMWKRIAERLATHKATHLVELMTSRGYWMLPLVELEGRLHIVPSDKSRDMGIRREDVQPGQAANESQPVAPDTNSTSGAASSRP
jgi:hypothetical protein